MAKLVFTMALALMVANTLTSAQDIYDKTKQQCCNGNIQTKERGSQCCGQEVYNTLEKICCFNKTIDWPSHADDTYHCCYDDVNGQVTGYDSRFQRCCEGRIITVDNPEQGKIYICCGTELYDLATQACCAGAIVDLGDDQVCCGDEVVTIEHGSSLACCGDYIIDTNTQICCMSMDYDKYRFNGDITKKVHDRTSDDELCCGHEIYNSETEVCCIERRMDKVVQYVLAKPKGMNKSYYPVCCGKEIILINSFLRPIDGRFCCLANQRIEGSESVPLNPKTERCCAGIITAKSEDNDNEINESCCESSQEFYDINTHVCTAAGVRLLSEDGGLTKNQDYCMSN